MQKEIQNPGSQVPISFSNELVAAQAALRLHILYHLADAAQTDDVLQETNLYLMQRWQTFDPARGKFIAWACEMANHQIQKFRLYANRERLVFDDEMVALLGEELAAEDPPPEDLRADALRACVRQLPADARERIRLRFVLDKSLPWLVEHYRTTYQAEASRMKRILHSLYSCVTRHACDWEGQP